MLEWLVSKSRRKERKEDNHNSSRRDFLRTAGILGGGAVALIQLPGCALPLLMSGPYRRKYHTIAHEILDIERVAGAVDSDYELLDEIIDGVKGKVEVKPEYNGWDVTRVIDAVVGELEDRGFSFKENGLLNEGLKTGTLDCDTSSFVYLGVAEVLGLPMYGQITNRHMVVNIHIADGTELIWDPANLEQRTVEEMMELYNVSPVSIQNGAYLTDMNRERLRALAYSNVGIHHFFENDFETAESYFRTAIGRDTVLTDSYFYLGRCFEENEMYQDAVACYEMTLEIDSEHDASYIQWVGLRYSEKGLDCEEFIRPPRRVGGGFH